MSNDKKPYFPLFVDLNEKQIVVVGAGTIAKRRIRTLVSFTNHLTVIAPEVNRELLDMQKAGMLRIKRKNYEREDIYDADYVIAATNDHQINSDIYSACKVSIAKISWLADSSVPSVCSVFCCCPHPAAIIPIRITIKIAVIFFFIKFTCPFFIRSSKLMLAISNCIILALLFFCVNIFLLINQFFSSSYGGGFVNVQRKVIETVL